MSFNKIVVVGNIGRDAEVKFTPQGQQVCEFSVATNEKRTNGEVETTWFQISAWGKLAETCSQYLSKGREVYIEGRLRVREWSDREGRTRFSLEVNATEVRFLGNRASETNSQQEEIPAQQAIQAPQTVEVAPVPVAKEVDVVPVSKPKAYTKTYKNSGNGKASKVTVKDPFI